MAIWQHSKRVLSIFSPRMRRNGYLGTSGQKSDPAILSSDLDLTNALPLPSDVYWIYSMFLWYYDAWPFDLESVSCTVLLMSDPHTDFYYPTTIGYWVTITEYLITFPLSETVTAHAPCHVTSKRGQNFWNPWPQFVYFVTFRALRRRLSHVIGKK